MKDEVVPIVIQIVNDTQPAIRTIGFESFAILIKIFGMNTFVKTLEHLDNLKRKKLKKRSKLYLISVLQVVVPIALLKRINKLGQWRINFS